ncbi:MAG: ABC transporter substrate-binding protein, partial [Caldisphaeraceae archaeon]|nr:ABC transporter substrate-binding protein [Caldisphaeraceae archaeon]MEB3797750.1 ABC transporter substrate-binding protein [Caldisphaeraceae archaeon]
MDAGKLSIALIIIVVIGFSLIGISIYSLYNSLGARINSINNTFLMREGSIQKSFSYKVSSLAEDIGVLESKMSSLNASLSEEIASMESQVSHLASSSYFPVTIMSATNTSVTIPSYPKRIVSLDPATTEILIAIGAGKQLVGVDNASLHYLPPRFENELKGLYKSGNVTNIGNTYSGVDVEKVLSLRPNLVIGTYGWVPTAALSVFKEYGIPV